MSGTRSIVLRWLVSVSVIVVLAVGAAVAAIPTANGSVSFCIQKFRRVSGTGPLGPMVILDRIGTLRAIDFEAGQVCEEDEQRLGFNIYSQKGDPGPPGSPGPQGPQGPQGPPGSAGSETSAVSGTRFSDSAEAAALPSTNTGRVVGSLVLGQGHYAVTATVSLLADYDAPTASTYAAACWIDAAGDLVGQGSVQGPRAPAVRQSVTIQGVVVLADAINFVHLRCRDYDGAPTSWQQVTLGAVQVTEVRRVTIGPS